MFFSNNTFPHVKSRGVSTYLSSKLPYIPLISLLFTITIYTAYGIASRSVVKVRCHARHERQEDGRSNVTGAVADSAGGAHDAYDRSQLLAVQGRPTPTTSCYRH